MVVWRISWQPDCKIQRSGRNGQEIDKGAESPRLSPLWLSASSSACHGLLIITVITPLPTKPSATKMPENWKLANAQLLTCRCVSVMLLRSMQNTRRILMLKLKMMLCAWCCRWSSSVAHQSSLSAGAWSHHRLRRIMQPPPDCDTRIGIISPSERGWSLCKNNWKEPRSILMSSADRVAHIDGQLT